MVVALQVLSLDRHNANLRPVSLWLWWVTLSKSFKDYEEARAIEALVN